MDLALILRVLDLAAVAVFAVSGALAAGRKRMDLLGAFVLAALTAVGGGTLRDLLLDRHPIFWLRDPSYLVVIAGATLATIVYARVHPPPERLLLIADALGLALAAIAGAQIAESRGLPSISIVLLGTMTGTAGGVLRDVLSAEIPHVLTRMDTEIWKVRFKLPQESKGEVEIDVKAGADSKTEKKAIG